MTHRFWPISISGAAAVFFAGAFSAAAVAFAVEGQVESAAVLGVAIWLLLHHAAETAHRSLRKGTYSIGWFGIRSGTDDGETVVSAPASKTGEAA